MRAHQQKNEVSSVQMVTDLVVPLLPGRDPPVVPNGDHACTIQETNVRLQFVAQPLIFMGVGAENFDGPVSRNAVVMCHGDENRSTLEN